MAIIRALTGGKSVPLPEIPISEKELGTPVQDPRAKTTDDVGGVFARLFQRRENRQPTPKREVKALTAVITPMTPKIYNKDILTIGNAIREVYNSGENASTKEFTTGDDVRNWLGGVKSQSRVTFKRYIDLGMSCFPIRDRALLEDALIERKTHDSNLLTIGNAIREVYNLEEGKSTEEFFSDTDVKLWLKEVESKISTEKFGGYLLRAWKGFPHEKRAELIDAYYTTLRAE